MPAVDWYREGTSRPPPSMTSTRHDGGRRRRRVDRLPGLITAAGRSSDAWRDDHSRPRTLGRWRAQGAVGEWGHKVAREGDG